MKPLLECRSITVAYPIADGVLRLYGEGVSFNLEEGGFLSVVGGSGWGKSTLVNIVLGLEKPTRGIVQLDGENMTEQSFVKRSARVKTAAVFQRPTALPQLTVLQNLHLALAMMGIPKRDRDERIKEAMTFFGLEKLSHSYPDSLSGLNKDHGMTILMTTALPRHASTAKHQIHLRPPIFQTEQPIAR